MRISEHIIIKTAFFKIILSQIIIITQSERNAVTLGYVRYFIDHMDTFRIYEPFNCFRLSSDLRDTLKKALWFVENKKKSNTVDVLSI